MNIVSRNNALEYYQWGTKCECWNLVNEDALSVKLEKMPPGTSEEKHFHQFASQFFFILKGEAVFEIENKKRSVSAQEGIWIKAGKKHRILNDSQNDLEFLLLSQPPTTNDRINCID